MAGLDDLVRMILEPYAGEVPGASETCTGRCRTFSIWQILPEPAIMYLPHPRQIVSVPTPSPAVPPAALSRPSLERRLRSVHRDMLRMGALVEQSCLMAKEALCDRNLAAAKHLKVHDKAIDKLYRQIEVDCIHVLSLESPVTQDLRKLSAFMQMIRDLERIGDYAKDIGEVSIKLFPYPVHPCLPTIQIMLDRCRSMVALCLAALSEFDAAAGVEIKQKDDAVDEDYETIYEQLVQTPMATTTMEPVVLLVLVIRYLERIADHATNVGRRVTFIVTGERF